MTFSSLLRFGSCLAFLLGGSSVNATCQCKEVCPSYTDLWVISSDCPSHGLERSVLSHINRGGLKVCDKYETAPEGGCACNLFGCNCEGCGCNNGGGRVRTLLLRQPRGLRPTHKLTTPPPLEENANDDENDDCTDYNYYMSLTEDERNAHVVEKHCSRNNGLALYPLLHTVNGAHLRAVLESLADSSGDGMLSCLEFNNAVFDFDASFLCGLAL